MEFVIGFLKIVILFGTLVTIHELGHFLVAKACDVKVHKFAIGFGPKILTKVKGETEYTLRAIPFGGFVQMEGEDRHSTDERAFNNKPVWQRIIIVAAGATVNILFALILYFSVCVNFNLYTSSIIEYVEPSSLAYISGLRDGDKIVEVDGKGVVFQSQVLDLIGESKSTKIPFIIERDGQKLEIEVTVPEKEVGMIGAAFNSDGEIAYVQEGGEAKEVGLKEKDKIIAINEIENVPITQVIDLIKNNANNEIEVRVKRDEKDLSFRLTPSAKTVKVFDVKYKVLSNLKLSENLFYAINETKYYFIETLKGFATFIFGKAENASVMGPVGIAGEITKTENWNNFFYLMAAISLSLGLCNLLPIPALDGGKILFLLIELIRKKPMSEKTEIAAQAAGFGVIILIAVFVTFKDVINLF